MVLVKVASIGWLKITSVTALTGFVELTAGRVTASGEMIQSPFFQPAKLIRAAAASATSYICFSFETSKKL
jgi:hypothetical protein